MSDGEQMKIKWLERHVMSIQTPDLAPDDQRTEKESPGHGGKTFALSGATVNK